MSFFYSERNIDYTIIEDFEDNDINEYSLDTDIFETTSEVVKNKKYALKVELENATKQIVTTNYNLKNGNVYRGNIYIDGNAISGIIFGVQDENSSDGYWVTIDTDNDNFELYLLDDGTANLLGSESDSININQNEWYEIKIDWGSQNMYFTLFDNDGNEKAKFRDTDSTYTSGGLGFRMEGFGIDKDITYFDFVREMK